MSNENQWKVVSSPIKWVGGKSRLRKHIVELIPPHTCYVELFAGAAWVLFGKPPSEVEVINDVDGELMNFFRVIKYKPEEFIETFEWDLVSREEFERLANLNIAKLTDIERAHRFFYIIMAGWGGELKYPRFQTSISDGGHGNRLIGALKHLRNRIEPVHKRLCTVIIENLDWEECLDRYDRLTTVMYIDPPYPKNKVNYFHNMQNWEDHQRLAERLTKTKCKWILSSFDIPEIRNLYSSGCFHTIPVQAFSGMKKQKNDGQRVLNREVLITNFPPEGYPVYSSDQHGQLRLIADRD
ncbi:MAG: DNA adenine methylase [Chloroflexi bacterium]|nr:DNA adenine methylase [Chloroflexota bacterium]MBM3243172.1 DNA adenine methylase [Candidatus Poribacteria bacterium]